MTPTQKTQLREALLQAFTEFKTAFSSFSDEEVNTQSAPGKWTPAQVASHIILATDGVPDGKTAPGNRPIDVLLPAIRPWWEDMNQKFTSPEPLQPDDKPRAKKEVLSELDRAQEKDLNILDSKDMGETCMDFALPNIGYLTRFEWLWFIQMHLNRHTYQLTNFRKAFDSKS